jgi:hypothetical protein
VGDFTDFFAGIQHAINAGSAAALRRRSCRTRSTCPSPTIVVRRRCMRPAHKSVDRMDSACSRARRNRRSGRAPSSTSNWNSACGSVLATHRESRFPWRARGSRSSDCACSTTGRRGTSRNGRWRRSARFSQRTSARRCRHGWLLRRPWRRFASRSRRVPQAIRVRFPTCGTTGISAAARSTSNSKRCCRARRCGQKGCFPSGFLAATHAICIGRWRRWLHTIPAAAATSHRAISSAAVPSPRPTLRVMAASANFRRTASSRSYSHPVRSARSSRTATRSSCGRTRSAPDTSRLALANAAGGSLNASNDQ